MVAHHLGRFSHAFDEMSAVTMQKDRCYRMPVINTEKTMPELRYRWFSNKCPLLRLTNFLSMASLTFL